MLHALFATALFAAFALWDMSPAAAILVGLAGIGALGYSFFLAARSGHKIAATGDGPELVKSAKYTAAVSVVCAVLVWAGLLMSGAEGWLLGVPLLLLGGAAISLIWARMFARAVTVDPEQSRVALDEDPGAPPAGERSAAEVYGLMALILILCFGVVGGFGYVVFAKTDDVLLALLATAAFSLSLAAVALLMLAITGGLKRLVRGSNRGSHGS